MSGFWEGWRGPLNPGKGHANETSYYENDLLYFDQIIYSFGTLDDKPNATKPNNKVWDGNCLYDTATGDCIENSFGWADPSNPQAKIAEKNHALYREVKNNGKLFIFGIGGWSDLTGFMSLDQV